MWLSQLALQAPFFALPVIVLLNVDPARNASFYVAWSIMSVVFIGCLSISQVVLERAKVGGEEIKITSRVGQEFPEQVIHCEASAVCSSGSTVESKSSVLVNGLILVAHAAGSGVH